MMCTNCEEGNLEEVKLLTKQGEQIFDVILKNNALLQIIFPLTVGLSSDQIVKMKQSLIAQFEFMISEGQILQFIKCK
ncbi:MAG: hypothetical protein IPL23_08045 [Saprospiraceae bacterium]|nr:hypothetical protein [Saprospiraceae bacterium]